MQRITEKKHPNLYAVLKEMIYANNVLDGGTTLESQMHVPDKYDLKKLDAEAAKLNKKSATKSDFPEELQENLDEKSTELELFCNPLDEQDVVLVEKYGIHALQQFLNDHFNEEL